MGANGNVPASQLRVIDEHGTRLRDWVADVWARMVADARTDGVTLRPSYTPPPAPAGLAGYRDYDMQKWLYRHPIGPVAIARPGTSTHGIGNRLDVGSGVAWVAAHRGRYGLSREFPSEPWHFGFRTSLAGLGLTPITPIKTTRSNEMSKLYHKADSTPTLYALAGDSPGTPANWLETTAQSLANAWSAQIGGPSAAVNAATWDTYKAAYLSPLAVAGGPDGGASTADVNAAADRVIAAVPTAEQNATATADELHNRTAQ